jgi:hypothetical protein
VGDGQTYWSGSVFSVGSAERRARSSQRRAACVLLRRVPEPVEQLRLRETRASGLCRAAHGSSIPPWASIDLSEDQPRECRIEAAEAAVTAEPADEGAQDRAHPGLQTGAAPGIEQVGEGADVLGEDGEGRAGAQQLVKVAAAVVGQLCGPAYDPPNKPSRWPNRAFGVGGLG